VGSVAAAVPATAVGRGSSGHHGSPEMPATLAVLHAVAATLHLAAAAAAAADSATATHPNVQDHMQYQPAAAWLAVSSSHVLQKPRQKCHPAPLTAAAGCACFWHVLHAAGSAVLGVVCPAVAAAVQALQGHAAAAAGAAADVQAAGQPGCPVGIQADPNPVSRQSAAVLQGFDFAPHDTGAGITAAAAAAACAPAGGQQGHVAAADVAYTLQEHGTYGQNQ